ncbi:MAG TPA: hypothetical protein VMU59_00420 [Caulobacteraceae bacterium]|nr:hypothetical protein [Caulobacteraceae bacterium]
MAFDSSGRVRALAVEKDNEIYALGIDPETGVATYAKRSLALKDMWSLAFLPPQAGR